MVANSAMVPFEEAARRGLPYGEKEWMALSSGRQQRFIDDADGKVESVMPVSNKGPLTLIRYREIERMLKPRGKKALATEPRGWGFGAWQSALADLAREIDEKRFAGLEVTIGPKAARSTIKLADLVDGAAEAGHLACTIAQEEWVTIIRKALVLVKPPVAATPEQSAAEAAADAASRAVDERDRRIAELESELAQARSRGATIS